MLRVLFSAVLIFVSFASRCQAKKEESSNAALENDSNKFILSLIREGKIAGFIYDSTKITLRLKSNDGEREFSIDSVFRLRKMLSNKIGFFVAFNYAAANTKFGYVEIMFNPYQTKVAFLNDLISKITITEKKAHSVILVYTSTYPRYEEKTEILYLIKSYNLK